MTASVVDPAAASASDRWNRYNATVLTICIAGWVFDVYEQTILQLVTPLIITEWGITPATIGIVTTIARWIGLIGTLAFPALADLYGRKPILILAILGYCIFSGLTGFATGWMSLLTFTALTRISLSGEEPVGMVMVGETAPTKWRATALGGLVGGYPLGYMLCSGIALIVVPMWGWRSLYFLGVLPALLVLWIRIVIKESPRYERVTAVMLNEGLRKRLDLWSPVRQCPRDMLIATLCVFLYLFTWFGWAAWMPLFLANEKHLGFETTAIDLTIWMFVAIFAYWICGALSDHFGRRHVIPAFVIPAAILLVVLGSIDDPRALFWAGLVTNFLITGSFGSGLGYTTELFPTQIRGAAVGAAFAFGAAAGSTAPAIVGWIATAHSIAAGLPLLAFTFFLLAPLFYFARETTRRELTDFVAVKGSR